MDKRSQGSGCPFCSGRAVCQHNTLANNAPEVALFWDAKKNHALCPDQVTVGSNIRAHLKCCACLHEWQASVKNKVCGRTGCPKCAKAHAGRNADGTRQKHPTFARAKHALLEQWGHDKNSKNEIFPTTPRCKAASEFGGAAVNVHKARCTAGRLFHTVEPGKAGRQEAVLSVLATSFVSATHWKPYAPTLLLILILK